MAKILGAVLALVGIGIYIATAYASFDRSAKVILTIIAALLIIYGIVSLIVGLINKEKKEAKSKKEKPWYKKWWVIVLLVLFGFGLLSSLNEFESRSVQSNVNYSDIVQNAKSIPYDSLFRYNEAYIGTPVLYEGEIIQTGGSSGNYYYRIDITKKVNSFGITYEDTVYVTYEGNERFLEKDIVQFYGIVKGTKSYTSVLRAKIEIPYIDAVEMNLIQKAGNGGLKI